MSEGLRRLFDETPEAKGDEIAKAPVATQRFREKWATFSSKDPFDPNEVEQ